MSSTLKLDEEFENASAEKPSAEIISLFPPCEPAEEIAEKPAAAPAFQISAKGKELLERPLRIEHSSIPVQQQPIRLYPVYVQMPMQQQRGGLLFKK